MVQIRECEGRQEEEFFWEQLQVYFERDMFPDPEDEDRAYFLGSDYRSTAVEMAVMGAWRWVWCCAAIDVRRQAGNRRRDGEYLLK